MNSPEQAILTEINRLRSELRRPVVVALDGGSGAGKTTIAERLMQLTEVAVVQLDGFYQTAIPESELPRKTVEERLTAVFDWPRIRSEALEPLRAGTLARWRAFDFVRGLGEAGTYILKEEVTEVAPAPTVLLEGAYSASPPLRDLIDLAVLVDVPSSLRLGGAPNAGTMPDSWTSGIRPGMKWRITTLNGYVPRRRLIWSSRLPLKQERSAVIGPAP